MGFYKCASFSGLGKNKAGQPHPIHTPCSFLSYKYCDSTDDLWEVRERVPKLHAGILTPFHKHCDYTSPGVGLPHCSIKKTGRRDRSMLPAKAPMVCLLSWRIHQFQPLQCPHLHSPEQTAPAQLLKNLNWALREVAFPRIKIYLCPLFIFSPVISVCTCAHSLFPSWFKIYESFSRFPFSDLSNVPLSLHSRCAKHWVCSPPHLLQKTFVRQHFLHSEQSQCGRTAWSQWRTTYGLINIRIKQSW